MIPAAMDGSPPSPAPAAPPGEPPPNRPPAADELSCPDCGYDLRGIASARCPECGLAIDREQLGVSRIPWSHRRLIGRVRAYGRTVWRATFHTRRLSAEAARPVHYGDAQRFRLVTVLIATLTLLAVIAGAVALGGGIDELSEELSDLPLDGFDYTAGRSSPTGVYDLVLPWAAGAMVLPVIPLGILVFMLLVTGVASYWFHPAALPVVRQNRAVALSYYACAPLAFLPVPGVTIGALMLMASAGWETDQSLARSFLFLILLTYVTLPLIVLATYVATLRLLRGAAQAGAGRMWLAAIVIPVTWVLSAALALFVLPWVVGFVSLVIESFR